MPGYVHLPRRVRLYSARRCFASPTVSAVVPYHFAIPHVGIKVNPNH